MEKFIKFILLLSVLLYSISYACAENNISNCKEEEQIFYSCETKTKTISFCASPKEYSPAYLEYRFGKPYKIEMLYKTVKGNPIKKFNRTEVLGANNASTEIWFENNGFTYVLSEPVKGDAALEIVKNKKILSRLICRKNFIGNSSAPSDLIEQKDPKLYLELSYLRQSRRFIAGAPRRRW